MVAIDELNILGMTDAKYSTKEAKKNQNKENPSRDENKVEKTPSFAILLRAIFCRRCRRWPSLGKAGSRNRKYFNSVIQLSIFCLLPFHFPVLLVLGFFINHKSE